MKMGLVYERGYLTLGDGERDGWSDNGGDALMGDGWESID